MADLPELSTERLCLRQWRDDDFESYFALCADPDVMRWHGAAGVALTRTEAATQMNGFRTRRADHGQGIATEGDRASVDFAFGTLGLEQLVSITRPENHNSWNVMQKLGMTLERTTTHPEYNFDIVVYALDAP